MELTPSGAAQHAVAEAFIILSIAPQRLRKTAEILPLLAENKIKRPVFYQPGQLACYRQPPWPKSCSNKAVVLVTSN